MRKSRFTESQIVGILKEGEAGIPIAHLVRKHGISRATYFWPFRGFPGPRSRIFTAPAALTTC